jgi:heme-degrading monooxygenase HmoA
MHAGVVTLRVRPEMVEEAIRIYRDSVLPELREMEGFEGGYVLTAAESGKGYIIGLWRTHEDAERFQSSGSFREQASKFEEVLAEAPSREICEVSVQA